MRRIPFLAAVCLLCLQAATPLAAARPGDAPSVGQAVRHAVSPPLRDIVPEPPRPGLPREIINKVDVQPPGQGPERQQADPLRQTTSGPTSIESTTPAPALSFEGTSDQDNADLLGFFIVPPDTEGDVGPSHYVQMNNLVYEIFDKSGNSVVGPLPNNSLWQSLGGICADNNDGDPIVLYDQGADRWILSQFAIGGDGHQCVAVSQTNDPTGAYNLYDFVISPGCFNDYPKMGVWPDGYYLTANEFCASDPFGMNLTFRSAIAVAFEKPAMVDGQAAGFAKFDIDTPDGTAFSVQPSHWEGPTAPDSGRPNVFIQAFDDETWGSGGGPDGYQLWEFSADWSTSSFSFTHLGQVNATEFDANLCGFAACVPQPDNGELLDTLSQFTMYRAHYRKFSGHEVLVGNHTVDATGSDLAGVRWFELRNDGTGWTVHQSGTYAPADGDHRWMASAAMDAAGGIAVGFSVSSDTTFPAVRYASRSAGDPAGELSGGEAECFAGSGSQIDSSNRWGDYSTMSVDPVDDCTFWMTNEYYATTGSFDFQTRICAFTLPDCAACEVTEDPEQSCSDGVDNDCDGLVDNDDPDCCPDADGDGFSDASCGGTDCDDSDPAINPGAAEACDDFVDNDCDGLVDCDDGDCSDDIACCPDADGDGFSDASCGGTDCDDSDPAINPGAAEVCDDFLDNDCDGLVDCDDDDCIGDPACDTSCLPDGSLCTEDVECCSNKCRGRPGGKTCK